MNNMSPFDHFCYHVCDRMYDPRIPEESQCTGYKLLKQMVKEDITPAGINEALRYSVCPTTEELLSPVPLKYLKFLHVNLRLVIIKHWEHIKKLEL